MTKEFPVASVLSVVTGRLLCEIGGVYEILNWMTGQSLFTHQLPRVSAEATPVIVAALPGLQTAIDEADQVSTENWPQWLATWTARYGAKVAVPQLTIEQHERIDPLSELAEKVHPSKVVVVYPGASE